LCVLTGHVKKDRTANQSLSLVYRIRRKDVSNIFMNFCIIFICVASTML